MERVECFDTLNEKASTDAMEGAPMEAWRKRTDVLSRGLIEPFNGCSPALPSILSINAMWLLLELPEELG